MYHTIERYVDDVAPNDYTAIVDALMAKKQPKHLQ